MTANFAKRLSGLFLLPILLSSPAQAQPVCGDLDNNGGIFASDALRLLQKAVGIETTLVCPNDEGGPFDATALLADLAFDTYFLTYADLAASASDLKAAADALAAQPSELLLAAAQQAWRDTREPWEASEGFLFGPVDEQGLDPRLDTWPVNKTDFDSILGSSVDLRDPDVVEALDDAVKGFHTIEFLLFDDGTGTAETDFIGARDAASIVAAFEGDDRRGDYLVGASADLALATAQLSDAWDGTGGNFAFEFASAGKGSLRWPSQGNALQEAIEAIAGIADEVANGKISDPFDQADTKLVESQFSFNSLADFRNNIVSIRNVYEGSNPQGCTTAGLSAYVIAVDPELDARIRAEIDTAIASILAIAEPFRDSINDPSEASKIVAAVDAVNVLFDTFSGDLFDRVVNEGEFAF